MSLSRLSPRRAIGAAAIILVVCGAASPLLAQTGSEDCISFDPSRTTVQRASGRWKITVGDMWLLDFGNSRAEAEQALKIIRHYRLDRQCFVGRPDPSFTYFLADGAAPSGPISGEDCAPFNPGGLQLKLINGRWKIVEGSHWLLDFGKNQGEAREALAIILRYGFNHLCFVGRPQAAMTYLRKDAAVSRVDQQPAVPQSAGGESILAYGRTNCGLCKRMMQELDRAGYAYSFLNVDRSDRDNREMWNHVARAFPGTDSVTLPVMVVNGTVLLSPSFEEVQRLLGSSVSQADRGSTATRPSGSSGRSSWDEGKYSRYNFSSFFQYPPVSQRIEPGNIDYPLLRAALFYETNRVRFNSNRKVLLYDRACGLAAQAHAEDMAARNFFDHQNPYDASRRTLQDRAALFGIRWTHIAENISMGDISGTYAEVARDIVERWRKSPGHSKNMLMATLTHMGTGAFDAGSKWADFNLKCVQVFAQIP